MRPAGRGMQAHRDVLTCLRRDCFTWSIAAKRAQHHTCAYLAAALSVTRAALRQTAADAAATPSQNTITRCYKRCSKVLFPCCARARMHESPAHPPQQRAALLPLVPRWPLPTSSCVSPTTVGAV